MFRRGGKMIYDGIINIDTEAAIKLGFTSDRFNPASYLWKQGNTIIISFIISKQKGEFCKLIQTIRKLGYDFEIPTPSRRMIEIGIKQKWKLYKNSGIEYLTNRKLRLRARILLCLYGLLDTFWMTTFGSWLFDMCVSNEDYWQWLKGGRRGVSELEERED